MVLVVAEKPSVAKELARVIGASQKGDGFITGNGFIVTWAIGHLVALSDPGEVNEEWKHWKMELLPMLPEVIPLKVLPKTKKQFQTLKKLMNANDTERIICATDAGREGELIFRYIYQMAKCKKPFSRLWISSMTDEAIRQGFQNLRNSNDYDALYESAKCRSEADWLVGMNASRAFTIRYHALLSVGRVQTPTLQILVKRRLEIDTFQPQPYWLLQVFYSDFSAFYINSKSKESEDTHISSKEEAEMLAHKIAKKTATVFSVENIPKKELAPQLYDLTSLQRDANKRFGFSASRTLDTAQSLYEKYKLITYPRTDSCYLPLDMVQPVQKLFHQLPQVYGKFAEPLLKAPFSQNKRIFDNSKITDHHAIIPTGKHTELEKLPADEQKIYDLICRRLIAAFYKPYLYDAIKIITVCEDESFLSKGCQIKQLGWKEVYQQFEKTPEKETDEEEQRLPRLKKGDTREVEKTEVLSRMTKPPKEHTDASLLSVMEHAGRYFEDEELAQTMKGCSLGTPATRAAIIDRLIEVGYAKRKGRQIMATPKGVALIKAAPEEITSPETTGRWELALEKIAYGQGNSTRFMDGIRHLSTFLTDYAINKAPEGVISPEESKFEKKHVRKSTSSVCNQMNIPCPICHQGKITENSKAFGCSRWKEGCKFTIWKNAVQPMEGPEINAKLIQLLFSSNEHTLRGSTGLLFWKDDKIGFQKNK